MSKLLSALTAAAFAATLSFNAVAADAAKPAPAKKHVKHHHHHMAKKHHKKAAKK